MENGRLEKKFETWKRILWITVGAVATLSTTAIVDKLTQAYSGGEGYSIGWFGVWFLVFLASFLPGFVLLLGSHYTQLSLHERLNTIFGFFVVAWFALLAAGIQIDAMQSWYLLFLIALAIGITIGYWRLRLKGQRNISEMFP